MAESKQKAAAREQGSAKVAAPEGPIDGRVQSPLTPGRKGDPGAGEVAFVNKTGDIDGSAAPDPVDPDKLKTGSKYKAKLTFEYNSKGGTNSPPHRVLEGDTIEATDIAPEDAKAFVRLGYIEAV